MTAMTRRVGIRADMASASGHPSDWGDIRDKGVGSMGYGGGLLGSASGASECSDRHRSVWGTVKNPVESDTAILWQFS